MNYFERADERWPHRGPDCLPADKPLIYWGQRTRKESLGLGGIPILGYCPGER